MAIDSDTNDEVLTPLYSIGTTARMLDISVHTLRHYEREGLILPYKSESNQRWYSKEDVDRLRCIRSAIKDQKLSIEGIKRIHALIPCWQMRGCSDRDRANCDAFLGHERGCWSYDHKRNSCTSNDCRLCEVYRLSVNCEEVKRSIVRFTSTPQIAVEQ